MKRFFSNATGAVLSAVAIILIVSALAYSAVTQISGLAVAQTSTQWNSVNDAVRASSFTKGSALFTPCFWISAGTSCNRAVGNADGAQIVEQQTVGTSFFTVERDNIAAASVNLAFGFTSRKVALEFPLTNTDEVCVDWTGGTAACPAVNTAGDDRFAPGTSIFIDDYQQTSLSVISASGTQTVYVRAWR